MAIHIYKTHIVWFKTHSMVALHFNLIRKHTLCMVYKTHTLWFIKYTLYGGLAYLLNIHCMVALHIYKIHTVRFIKHTQYGDLAYL